MEKTTWYGPSTCDFCGRNCQKTLYDGKTKSGTWATMCRTCFIENGMGLGYGVGQKYTLNPETQKYELDTATYNSKDEPKAKGLNFNIDFPTDWESKESDSSKVVRHFEKTEFNGIELKAADVFIMVEKYSDSKTAALEYSDYFSKEGTKARFEQQGHSIILIQKIKISNLDSWLVESRISQKNVPFPMFTRLLKTEFAYKNYVITIQASATGDSLSNSETLFKEVKSTFLEMINSFTILDE